MIGFLDCVWEVGAERPAERPIFPESGGLLRLSNIKNSCSGTPRAIVGQTLLAGPAANRPYVRPVRVFRTLSGETIKLGLACIPDSLFGVGPGFGPIRRPRAFLEGRSRGALGCSGLRHKVPR